VTDEEDSSPLFWTKILLTVALAMAALVFLGPLAAVLTFFAMAVLDKLDKIARRRNNSDD
jgi:phosphatidylglycerophosphate synthase